MEDTELAERRDHGPYFIGNPDDGSGIVLDEHVILQAVIDLTSNYSSFLEWDTILIAPSIFSFNRLASSTPTPLIPVSISVRSYKHFI